MAVKLVAKQGFTSFGNTYVTGAIVDAAEAGKWPDSAMAKRLNSGFLEYREVAEDAPSAGETGFEPIQRASNAGQLPDESQSVDQDVGLPAFHKMSTEELEAFAKDWDCPVSVDGSGGLAEQDFR